MTHAPSLEAVVREHAQRRPDAPAFEAARSGLVVPYRDLAPAVDAWRDALQHGPATVLLTVPEPVALAVALVGVIAAGGRVVAIDPSTPAQGVEAIARRLGEDASPVGVDERGLPIGPIPSTGRPHGAGSTLLFTSGSSGVPKGVELSEARLLTVAREVVLNQGLTPDDRGFNPLPLFHVNAQVVGVLATIVSGGTLVLDARFHRTGFWPLLAERRITWLNAVPAMLAVLARTGAVEPPAGLRFIRSASAPLPEPVRRAFGDVQFVVSWGMTEAASQITATPPVQALEQGVVGFPLGVEVAVRDEQGRDVGLDGRGELWIRGAGVIDRYLDGVAADRFDGAGWLRTGDVGHLRPDGQVVVSGRADDVINRGGELVDPAEVEAVLLQDDRVQEAAVVARASEVLGQEAVALVVLAPDADPDGLEPALLARAAGLLPTAKRPVEVRVVPDLPRTPAGKVSRRLAAGDLDAIAR